MIDERQPCWVVENSRHLKELFNLNKLDVMLIQASDTVSIIVYCNWFSNFCRFSISCLKILDACFSFTVMLFALHIVLHYADKIDCTRLWHMKRCVQCRMSQKDSIVLLCYSYSYITALNKLAVKSLDHISLNTTFIAECLYGRQSCWNNSSFFYSEVEFLFLNILNSITTNIGAMMLHSVLSIYIYKIDII